MSDYTTYPLENQFETQIVGEIQSSSTVPFDIAVKKAISFTPAAGGFYIILEPGTSKEEGMKVSSVSGTTWTISERGIPVAKGGSSTVTTHGGGSTVIITNNWSNFDDIATAINSKAGNAEDETITGDWTFSGDVIFSGSERIPVYANATARDAAITSPVNGMQVYNTADGKFQDYTGGAWVDRESGGTFPNASETVAGKVEIATTAEATAGTDTGGTGATLSVKPSDIITLLESYSTPSGTISAFGGSSAPTGWLLCDGTAGLDSVTDTTLADLYAVIGTTYGGTGADDFDLPDLRGNVPVGKDSGTFNTLGGTGGEETHLLTGAESGTSEHSHPIPLYNGGGATGGQVYGATTTLSSTGSTSNSTEADASSAHNNLQPYLVVNYIIKK